jgi:hypothetical protein
MISRSTSKVSVASSAAERDQVMPKFVKAIWSDIRERKNIELYLALITIAVIFIADIFGVNTESALLEIALAVLALLAYGLLENRRSQERVELKVERVAVSQSATRFFKEWDDSAFREGLKTAKSVSLLAIANYIFLSRNSEPIKQFLSRGGSLRCILVEPEGHAITMAADLASGHERQPKHLAAQVRLAIEQLRDLAAMSGSNRVQLKLVDFLPQAIITIIEHQNADGNMFVSLNGFNQPPTSRPSFTMRKSEDGRWFTFYQESYDDLWNWEQSRLIELGRE